MDEPRRSGTGSAGREAGGAAWSPSKGLLAVAACLVAGGVAAWWAWGGAPEAAAGPAAIVQAGQGAASGPAVVAVAASGAGPAVTLARAATPAAPTRAVPASTPHVSRRKDPRGDQTPDLSDYINDGDIPTTAEVIDRLHRAGVNSGLGAFSPPGTRPPLVGIAVPEDFPLPEGYVRHYQATDDGQRIEAILMFAPDYQLYDADHRPIPMPADRVVPPELAPPGLPIRRIVVPAPADAAAPGR
jgi:hypothetical protein